jgi:tripartite-type tricarboxylate transporter receptor subunit TctC
LAPAGTPAPVIEKLSKATNEALKDPKVVQALQVQALDPIGGTPDEFRKFIRSETERWAKIVEAMPKK